MVLDVDAAATVITWRADPADPLTGSDRRTPVAVCCAPVAEAEDGGCVVDGAAVGGLLVPDALAPDEMDRDGLAGAVLVGVGDVEAVDAASSDGAVDERAE